MCWQWMLTRSLANSNITGFSAHMNLIAVYTTVGTLEDARRLARSAVEAKLAACVQFENIESIYAWKGGIECQAEVRLVFKTTADLYDKLKVALLQIHPYELPAIYAVDVGRATEPYANWVSESTR